MLLTRMEKGSGRAGVEGESFLLHWSFTGGTLNLRWTTVVERTRREEGVLVWGFREGAIQEPSARRWYLKSKDW